MYSILIIVRGWACFSLFIEDNAKAHSGAWGLSLFSASSITVGGVVEHDVTAHTRQDKYSEDN